VEKTIEIGDTEVQITETDSGFEVAEVETNELVEYVRNNVHTADHESVRHGDYDRVLIVDSRNQVISPQTYEDTIDDDRLTLGITSMDDDELSVRVHPSTPSGP